MEYRVGVDELMETLTAWDKLIPGRGKVRLIACGGTALTLLSYKESTKDVDLLVPEEKEYQRLARFLREAGYSQATTYGWKRPEESMVYDLYPGRKVYSTELLSSPLAKSGHRKIREWKKIYLGALNTADLIISKMFRGAQADLDDCWVLLEKEKVDLRKLEQRFRKTAKYDVSEERVLKNFLRLMAEWKGRSGRTKA